MVHAVGIEPTSNLFIGQALQPVGLAWVEPPVGADPTYRRYKGRVQTAGRGMVRTTGIEPARSFEHEALDLAWLPDYTTSALGEWTGFEPASPWR